MSLYDSMRKALTPELFTQITDQLGDDFDFDLVPRSRLNKVIKQRNDLREQFTGNSQLPVNTQSAKAPKVTDEEDDDVNPIVPNIDELKKQWQKEQEDAVKDVKLQYAVLDKLRLAKAVDPEVIWKAGLIDKSRLKFTENGNIEGLDDVISDLVKTKEKLFESASATIPSGTGKSGGSDSEFTSVKTKEQFLSLSTDKQALFKKANPDIFKTFLTQ